MDDGKRLLGTLVVHDQRGVSAIIVGLPRGEDLRDGPKVTKMPDRGAVRELDVLKQVRAAPVANVISTS